MLLSVSLNRTFTSRSKSPLSAFPEKERETNKKAEGKGVKKEGFVLWELPPDFRAGFQIRTHLSTCSLSRSSKCCQAPDVWSGKSFGDLNLFDADLPLIGFFFIFLFKTFLPLSKSSSSAEKLLVKVGVNVCRVVVEGSSEKRPSQQLCPWFPEVLVLWGLRVGSSFPSVCWVMSSPSRKRQWGKDFSDHGLLSHGFHSLELIKFSYFFTNFLIG